MGAEIKTLKDMAGERWYARVSADEYEVDISRRADTGNHWIGPLIILMLGEIELASDDENDEEVWNIESEDGRNLFAIMALPLMARLVTWARAELDELNGIHFDGATDAGRFHRELRERLDWILDAVDRREPYINAGDHSLMSYDQAVKGEKR